jgi:hypothetical protein
VVIERRTKPICAVPDIGIGNKPIDGGNFLFTDAQRELFVATEPESSSHFRRWVGADEFINGTVRWCLWLGDVQPHELRAMPHCMKRVEAVRRYRLKSPSAPTQRLAATPTRFHVEFLPATSYLLVPRHSSETRDYIPIGFMAPDVLCGDANLAIADATPYHFAVLSSTMHNAWMRAVCGRLKSDYRYSASVVYNNFPWPEPNEAQRQAIEGTAQAILDARAQHPGATLADLYDPRTMPAELRKAHAATDKAVDAAYGYKGDKADAARVAYLFKRYQRLTSLLPSEKVKRGRHTTRPEGTAIDSA